MPTVQMMGMHTITAACQAVQRWRAIHTIPAACQAVQRWRAIHTIPAACQAVQIWEAIPITLAGYRAAHRLENTAMEKEAGDITGLVMEMAIIRSCIRNI